MTPDVSGDRSWFGEFVCSPASNGTRWPARSSWVPMFPMERTREQSRYFEGHEHRMEGTFSPGVLGRAGGLASGRLASFLPGNSDGYVPGCVSDPDPAPLPKPSPCGPSSVVSRTVCSFLYSSSRARCISKSSWRSRLMRCCSISRTTPWCMACKGRMGPHGQL